jgi:hypothetical protein
MLPAASFVTLVILSKMKVAIDGPLALVLRSSTHFCVSEPRDRVYGLLGLLKQLQRTRSLHSSLDPDYSKPTAHVYRDATRTSALERGDLRQLENEGYERHFSTFIYGLPSWVPNWYCSKDGSWELDAPYRLPVVPIAWKAWPGRTGFSWLGTVAADRNMLSIRGLVLTSIMAHSDAVMNRKDLATLSPTAIHNFISSAHALYFAQKQWRPNVYSVPLDLALTAGRLDMHVGKLCCMCVPAPGLCRLHLQPPPMAAFSGLTATSETATAVRSAIRYADLLAKDFAENARKHANSGQSNQTDTDEGPEMFPSYGQGSFPSYGNRPISPGDARAVDQISPSKITLDDTPAARQDDVHILPLGSIGDGKPVSPLIRRKLHPIAGRICMYLLPF